MEETEVDKIAKAVISAVAKLNVDTKSKEEPKPEGGAVVFNCPECGTTVKGMTPYCPNCGCGLEWEE